MRTFVIVNDYDYVQGGASKVAIETANLLFEKGENVVFFCGVSDKSKSLLNNKIKTISTNKTDCLSNKSLSGMMQGINNRSANKKMKELLSSLSGEIIVHVHGWTKCLSSSFIKVCKKFPNVKLVLTLHDFFSVCPNGGLFNYKKNKICQLKPMSVKCKLCNCDSRNYMFKMYRVYRQWYQNVIIKFRDSFDLVITISQLQYDILNKYFDNKKITFVYNPTSIDKKPDDRVHAENNKDYLYVGRITKDKGVDYLCEYFSKCQETLYIVGAGNLEEELKEKYKNNSNIHFEGWKPQSEVYEYMRKSRGLFVPSVYYEGAPLIVFEGLALGLPMAISSLCAGRDFVNSETGIVFDPYSNEEFNLVLKKFSDDKFLKNISKMCYANYWNNPFDKNRYINSLLETFNKEEDK